MTSWYYGLVLQTNAFPFKLLIVSYERKVNFFSEKQGWRKSFSELNILDLSCGNGRNLVLLNIFSFNVFAAEISGEIFQIVCQNPPKLN